MEEGRIKAIGPRDEVLQSVMKCDVTPAPAAPVRAPQSAPATLRKVG